MTSAIYVDTSAILALADKSHPSHARAVELLKTLDGPLVTSNLIILETASLISRKAGHRKAIDIIDRLQSEGGLKVYHIEPDVEKKGWETYSRSSKRDLEPTRAMSFALMRELGVRIAFTFDKAYRDAGFITVPMG